MFPIIKFKNIKKQFRKKIILDNINLEINQGDIFGIIGMSGSGKTTLLNILIGFLKLDQGEILYYSQKDKEYKKISENMTEARKIFGFASQAPSLPTPKALGKDNGQCRQMR